MYRLLLLSFCVVVAAAGCQESEKKAETGKKGDTAKKDTKPGDKKSETASTGGGGTELALLPKNTKIQFVGTHVGDDPKPRTGNFEDFSGTATIDGDTLKSLSVTIKTASLTTDAGDKLNGHLKTADFFDVRQYPESVFKSTSIKPESGDKVTVTGDLTLLDTTKSISFPATVKVNGGELSLDSTFTIDRTEFGMNYGPGQVEKAVSMTIHVGK